SGNRVNITSASLAAGERLTLTVSGSVSATARGTLVNTATVAAGAGTIDLNPGNNSATDADQQETVVLLNKGVDFDGDRKADIAVDGPATGEWHIVKSSTRNGETIVWGGTGDIPVPADYDGDGKTDLAVYRPSTGEWLILKSTAYTGETLTW